MKNIYAMLKDLKIAFEKYEHPAVFTVAEAQQYDRDVNTGESKNLFLRNKKGDKYFLVIAEATKKIDLKVLAEMIGERKFSFGSPEKMMELLNLTPGSVSPFGLIHDTQHQLHVIVDNGLLKYEKLGYHPNVNTATVVITSKDLQNFLTWTQNRITYLDF